MVCGLWRLRVASWSDAIRVEFNAGLGIDEVIIHAVEDRVVLGDGEWGPARRLGGRWTQDGGSTTRL